MLLAADCCFALQDSEGMCHPLGGVCGACYEERGPYNTCRWPWNSCRYWTTVSLAGLQLVGCWCLLLFAGVCCSALHENEGVCHPLGGVCGACYKEWGLCNSCRYWMAVQKKNQLIVAFMVSLNF